MDIVNTSIDFQSFKDETLMPAVVRLSYLYPEYTFKLKDKKISVDLKIADENNIRKEINFAVYREKIYLESLDIRKKIFNEL